MRTFLRIILVLVVSLIGVQAAQAQLSATVTNVKGACNGSFNGSLTVTVDLPGTTGNYSIFVFGTTFTQTVIRNTAVDGVAAGVPVVITGLRPDTYLVNVSDGVNPADNEFILIANVTPGISVTTDMITPNGDCTTPNGAIAITASGGTGAANLQYSWTASNGFTSTLQDITGLAGGDYTVNVSDALSNCVATLGPVTITDPQPLLQIVSNAGTQLICPGNDATVTLANTQNGVTYQIFQSGSPLAVSALGTGSGISLTVPFALLTDGGALTVQASFGACTPRAMTGVVTVDIVNLVLTNAVTSNTRCIAPFNGAINLTVAGTAGPFTYAWTGPGGYVNNVQDISALQDGSYTVLVTDVPSGCTATANIVVGVLTPVITISNVVTNNSRCVGPFNGAINITVSGSIGAPTFSWTGPGGFTATTEDISLLDDGPYTVVVTDPTSGCTATANIAVGDVTPTITLTNVTTNNSRCVAPFNGAINLTVAGSVGVPTFSWTGPGGFTASTEDISLLDDGTYTVLVTDPTSGCTATANIAVTDITPVLTITPVVTDNTRCLAPFNGAINITVGGSAGPFTFAWTGPGGFTASTEDVTTLQTGAYSVTVTQTASGCTVTANINVGNTPPTVTATGVVTNNTRCLAPFNGAIDLSVGGSVGPFTYAWTGPSGFTASTQDIAALAIGAYAVIVTDVPTGCTANANFNIINALPVISITNVVTNNTRCVAPFNGAINISMVGSPGPFTFAWTGPGGFTASTEDITALQPGSYSVTVTDTPTGCTASANINVGNTVPTITITNAVTNNTRCIAPFNGAINITPAGSVGPFTYSWTGPGGFTASTEDITALQNGSYSVTVTDTPTGCTASANINVGNVVPTLSVTNTVTTNSRCLAPFNGAVDITVGGSAGPFTFAWTGPGGFTASTEDITALQNGSYNVTVTDVTSGCTTTSNINVGNSTPTLSVANVVTNNTRCIAPFNGAINITIGGSAGPFTFSWTGPGGFTASTEDITTLQNGSYSVTVTDTNSGCTTTSNINVANSLPVLGITSAVTNNTRCIAAFNGAINITVSGGTGPLTFGWTGPSGFTASTEDITALEPGAYNVLVTDVTSGCTTTAAINVLNSVPALSVTSVVTDNTQCIAPFTGAINITVVGSAGPFTFSWTGPGGFTASTEDILALNTGSYSVTVTDTNSGCTTNSSINVNSASPVLSITNTVVDNSSCATPFNGSIDIAVAGSVGPFTFAWTGPAGFTAATEDINALNSGTYNVLVTDNNTGCTVIAAINVNSVTPTLVIANTVTNNTSCLLPFNGAIDISVSGTAGPFTFAWTGPGGFTAATEDITTLAPGTYIVTVTDQGTLCQTIANIDVLDNSTTVVISPDVVTDNTRCVAPFNGAISVTVTGSPGPFTYAWTGPLGFTAATEDIATLVDGNYDLTVTDNINGCFATASFTINNLVSPLTLTGTVTDNGRCAAPFGGAVDISVTGSAGPFTFAWTGPGGFTAATEDITAVQDGSYDVTVTDNISGCFETANFVIGNTTPTVSVTGSGTDNTKCTAPFTGAINITPAGTAGPFTFAWSGPGGFTAITEDLAAVQDGSYTVIVTDVTSGCTATTSVAVGLNVATFTVTGTTSDNSSCAAPFNGIIILNVTPVGSYSFAWTGPGGFTSNSKNITALAAGSYQVITTDLVTGCTDTQSFVVGDSAPVLSIAVDANSSNTSCAAPFDGALFVTASGGSGTYGFAWTGPNSFASTSEDISNIQDGDYTVVVTDLNLGCTASITVTVGDATPVVTLASQTITDNSNCIAPFNGAITVTGGGTPGPYTFGWIGPNGFTGTGASITGLEPGSYTVTITDQTIGCADSYTLAVGNNTPPVTVTLDSRSPNTSCTAPFTGDINISVSGTPGPFSFQWTGPNGFASTLEDIAQLEDGSYNVIATDDVLGCTATLVVNVVNNRPTVFVGALTVLGNSACSPPFEGEIRVLASGTAGPFNYDWTGPNGFTGNGDFIGALEGGDYFVTATDLTLGCVGTATINVADNTPVIAITTDVQQNTKCIAPFDGSIDILTVSGTGGPFAFSWTGPGGFTSSLQNISGLEPGDYDVTVTDTNQGCNDTYTINVPTSAPTLAVTSTIVANTSCAAPFTGSIDLSVTGTPGPFSFSWTGPNGFTSTVEDISTLEGGDYDVLVTDTNLGCAASFTLNVPDNSTPVTITLNSLTNNTSCVSPFNGAISITAGGSPGPFTISWTGPGGFTSALASIGGLAPGNYSVTVSDDLLGCSSTNNFTINNNAIGCGGLNCGAFTVTIVDVRPSCANQDDGQIVISVSGGTPNYVVTLTNTDGFAQALPGAGPNFSFSNLSPSNYQYTIQDGAGNICTLPYSLPLQTIVNATALSSSFTDVACFGEATGQAIINATGSQTGQYFYSIDGIGWTLFTPGNVISNLPPNGTYNILVGESIGDACRDTVSVTINNLNTEITTTFSITPATCNGDDGAITGITPAGGVGAPYEISLDGVAFAPGTSFNGLSGGSYILYVRDGSSCVKQIPFDITFPGFVDVDITAVNADCDNNGSSGSITAEITTTGTFQIALSTDQFNEPTVYQDYNGITTFNDLPRGQYFVYAKSSGAACPTRSAPINILGVYTISFNLLAQCSGDEPSLVLTDITGDPTVGAPNITIEVYERFTNALVVNESIPLPATGSFEFDFASYPAFMQSPGEYLIRISQIQSSALCLLTSEFVPYVVPRRLTAAIGLRTKSYPDIPTGTLQVINFDGGITPYDIRIEMDSASSPSLPSYQTDFEEVQLNSNLNFEKKYINVPAGRYKVQVMDSLGCFIQLTARVPLDTDIFVPNVFTPNDDGVNDIFFIRNLPVTGGAKLIVSNRWGKEVFSSSDYKNDWTGDGVSDGIYFYRLQSSESAALTGWVEIMRGQKP